MAAKVRASAGDVWSKLPDELLSEVYGRIASPLHRVRFAAVCRSWRVVKSWQQPVPTFPWLILSSRDDDDDTAKRVFCPADGELLRVSLPPEAIGKRLVGSHDGGWIAVTSNLAGGESLLIVNLFSGVEVPLPAKQTNTPWIKKVIFSEAPTSNRCVLAAILADGLAVCRVGSQSHNNQWISKCCYSYDDIAFGHGKLYGLLRDYLFMHDIHMTNEGNPVVSTLRILRTNTLPKFEGTGFNISYILKHGDKLLMAKRAWWSQENKGFFFKVFELVKTSNTRPAYGWTEVTTLDDHALFLSANCSRMVYQPAGRRGGVESNHIYYNNVNLIGGDKSIYNDVDLTRCDNGQHLYCGKDCKLNGVAMIMSVRYYVTSSHYNNLMWLLPPDL
ncbi:hypothetical protein VPH35_034256 [Triticum aestivum]